MDIYLEIVPTRNPDCQPTWLSTMDKSSKIWWPIPYQWKGRRTQPTSLVFTVARQGIMLVTVERGNFRTTPRRTSVRWPASNAKTKDTMPIRVQKGISWHQNHRERTWGAWSSKDVNMVVRDIKITLKYLFKKELRELFAQGYVIIVIK